MKTLIFGVAVVLAAAIAAPAVAQTPGYPNGTTTSTAPAATAAVINIGVKFEHGVATFEVFGFLPFGQVSFTLNVGNHFFTKAADANGRLSGTIRILDDGIGVRQPGVIGLPPLAVTGPTKVAIEDVTVAARPAGEPNDLRLSGPGANNGPRAVDVMFTVPPPDTARGTFARTGAMILRWSLVAAVLIGLGFLLVAGSRRRRHPADHH